VVVVGALGLVAQVPKTITEGLVNLQHRHGLNHAGHQGRVGSGIPRAELLIDGLDGRGQGLRGAGGGALHGAIGSDQAILRQRKTTVRRNPLV
jgi:hypothetical protein